MLFDSLAPDQVVDSEAALEFMKEATKLATTEELEDIGYRLERKSELFAGLLGPDAIGELDEAGFQRLLSRMFSLRRKSARLIRANGWPLIHQELERLLYDDRPPAERLERFLSRVGGLEPAMILSLATEVLHFTTPSRYWLWTYWIWHPDKGNGALALVIQDEIDLRADSPGAIYMNVGRATALVNAKGYGEGFTFAGAGLFGTDVFLACVYSVYMYTVFRVRLSQEFNRILPELPELVQRMLGVQRASVLPAAAKAEGASSAR